MNSPAENEVKVKPEINLNVDAGTALNLTIMEFDKKIGEAEAVVADLKKQRSAYIYDSNVSLLVKQAQQQQAQQQPAIEGQPPSPEIQGQPSVTNTMNQLSEVMSGPLS